VGTLLAVGIRRAELGVTLDALIAALVVAAAGDPPVRRTRGRTGDPLSLA
jgi:hypothetical protein